MKSVESVLRRHKLDDGDAARVGTDDYIVFEEISTEALKKIVLAPCTRSSCGATADFGLLNTLPRITK